MSNYERAMNALRAADAAGNTEDAQRLAAMARRLKGLEQPQPVEPNVGQELLSSVEDVQYAASQRTSPIVRDIEGNLNYQPLGEAIVDEQNNVFIRGAGDARIPANPQEHVALTDPQTGRLTVFARSPDTDIGMLTALGYTVAPGLLAPATAPRPLTAARTATRAAQGPSFARAGIEETLANTPRGPARAATLGVLERTPFAGAPIERGFNRATAQAKQRASQLARTYGLADEPVIAGERLQAGLNRMRRAASGYEGGVSPAQRSAVITSPTRATSFRTKQSALYDRAFDLVPPMGQGRVSEARTVLDEIATRFDNPALQNAFRSSRVGQIDDILRQSDDTVSFGDLRRLRTEVGDLIDKAPQLSDESQGQLRRLYGALTDDMSRMTEELGGATATTAVRRADQYTRAFNDRVDNALRTYVGRSGDRSPEAAYARLQADLGSTGTANIARARDLRRMLGPDDWGEIASTVIDQMGRRGGDFRMAEFIKNYQRMSPQGRSVLFGTTRLREARKELDNLVEVMQSVQGARSTLPPSGSSVVTTGAAAAGLAEGLASGGVPWGTIGVLTAGRAMSEALASPAALRALRSAARLRRSATQRIFNRQAPRVVAQLNAVIRSQPRLAEVLQPTIADIQRARAQTRATPGRTGQAGAAGPTAGEQRRRQRR